MKTFKLAFNILIIILLYASCTPDDKDDDIIENDSTKITEEALNHLHNNSSKKWRLIRYYSNNNLLTIHKELTSCMKDNVYTFFKDDTSAKVELGETSCFTEDYLEEPLEFGSASYSYYPESQDLYLWFSSGYHSEVFNYGAGSGFSSNCILLTSEKMVFRGADEGLVFEKIDD